MHKLLFILLLVFAGIEAWPQTDTVITRYHLDTLRVDSFYLVRIDSVFTASSPRPQVQITQTLFSDTFALRQFIMNERAIFTQIDVQRIELAKVFNRAKYLTARLECLIDSVFHGASCTDIGARSVRLPPPDAQKSGAPGNDAPATNERKKPVANQQRKRRSE